MKLDEIRNKIDKIDRHLLVLLQERMGLALRSKKFKKKISDPKREEDLLARAEKLKLDLVERPFTRQLLKSIIKESKRLQEKDRKLVAFQGEHGAYGEVASRVLYPAGAYIPCMEFIDVFKGVEDGYLDIGVVPVENSLEGAVTQVNDLLTTTPLYITGEKKIPIQHALISTQETHFHDIRMVYSHPQALAQCRDFLYRNKLEAKPYYDTAGAAKMLARENPKAAGAIASKLCAELYDLNILKENIEDAPSNSTRFLRLSKHPFDGKANKTSIMFALPHTAGKLHDVLGLFAKKSVNLTRIASMPLRSDPSSYCFFLDFEGSLKDEGIEDIIETIQKGATRMRVLGSYPSDGSVP